MRRTTASVDFKISEETDEEDSDYDSQEGNKKVPEVEVHQADEEQRTGRFFNNSPAKKIGSNESILSVSRQSDEESCLSQENKGIWG